ncbi:MAG TPA: response regulator [Candidatus Binatia bacterium]|jgi:CheY-like chemotaxis protein|nr:response regulator [Candidatus Binatia bacterium]
MSLVDVLVVEDDPETRESLVELLRSRGYRAAEASDGQEALDRLDREAQPRLIILDLAMAGMNGEVFLLLKQADARLVDIPVLVYSGVYTETPLDGVTEYVRKGESVDVLFDGIERTIGAPRDASRLH